MPSELILSPEEEERVEAKVFELCDKLQECGSDVLSTVGEWVVEAIVEGDYCVEEALTQVSGCIVELQNFLRNAYNAIPAQLQDTLCQCGHWFEEHNAEYCEGCGVGHRCTQFHYDPTQNTPGAIADRGGDHDNPNCLCALCVYERATMAPKE